MAAELPAAVSAFDAVAEQFDHRFAGWRSVAAQRRAVRSYLEEVFPAGARLLELGAGTGDDALYLLARGRQVVLTDGAPRMVARATEKVERAGHRHASEVRQLVLEHLSEFAVHRQRSGQPPFDGVYSNFAAFNCIERPAEFAAPLSRLVRPGGGCVLVVFGPFCPAEVLVQLVRGAPAAAVRRLRRGKVEAQLGGHPFGVWYRSPHTWAKALTPCFRLRAVRGIGILVPPSAAEPWISRFPRVLSVLEAVDRKVAAPLAILGDHVLLHFERTEYQSS